MISRVGQLVPLLARRAVPPQTLAAASRALSAVLPSSRLAVAPVQCAAARSRAFSAPTSGSPAPEAPAPEAASSDPAPVPAEPTDASDADTADSAAKPKAAAGKTIDLAATFTRLLAEAKSGRLRNMAMSYEDIVEAGGLARLEPAQVQQLVEALFKALTPRDQQTVLLSLVTDLSKAGVQFTEPLTATLVSGYALLDAENLSEWQWRKGQVALEQYVAERTGRTDRNQLIEAISRDLPRYEQRDMFVLATSLAEQAFAEGIAFEAAQFEDLLRACSLRGEAETAETWAARMSESGHQLSLAAFSSMITAHGIAGDTYKAQLWFEKYSESSLPVRSSPFIAFARALSVNGRLDAAIDVTTRLMPEAGVPLTSATIRELMNILLKQADFAGMRTLFETVSSGRGMPRLDIGVVNHMITALLVDGRLNEALGYVSRIGEQRLGVPQAGFLGREAVHAGDLDLGKRLVDVAIERGYSPEFNFFVGLIDAISSKPEQLQEAFDLLKKAFEAERKKASRAGARLPYIEMGITTLVRNSLHDIRFALDVMKFAEETKIGASRAAQSRLISAFSHVSRDKMAKLSVDDFRILFESAFGKEMQRGSTNAPAGANFESSRHASVREIISQLLKAMVEAGVQPTEQINKIVMNGYKRTNDVRGEAEWRVAMRPFGLDKSANDETPAARSQTTQQGDQRRSQRQPRQRDINRAETRNELIRDISMHCEAKETPQAIALFDTLIATNSIPPFVTVQSLQTMFATAKDVDGLDSVLRKILPMLNPQSNTYESYVSSIFTNTFTNLLSLGETARAAALVDELVSLIGRGVPMRQYEAFFQLVTRTNPLTGPQLKDAIRMYAHYQRDNVGGVGAGTIVKRCMLRIYNLLDQPKSAREIMNSFVDKRQLVGDVAFSDLIQVLSRSKDPEDNAKALEAFDLYLDQVPAPRLPVFNSLIDMHVRSGNIEGGKSVWKVAMQSQVAPNANTIASLMELFGVLGGEVATAERLFVALTTPAFTTEGSVPDNGIVTSLPPAATYLPNMAPSARHFRVLLSAHAASENPDTERMLAIVDLMPMVSLNPSKAILEIMVSTLARCGSMALATQFVERMAEQRLSPSLPTWIALIRGHFAAKNIAAARMAFESMMGSISQQLVQAQLAVQPAESAAAASADAAAAPQAKQQQQQQQPLIPGLIEAIEAIVAGLLDAGQRETAAAYIQRARHIPAVDADELTRLEARMFQ
ncbi:hypothetical protein HK105_202211 [Polyrhizophydium stewartii]|uniref:Uncharacterized protein n=1 Tax=Polyrhizophydium stewartii TaxID=2732419 RepID=A0ABR4NFP7_9FUNG